MNFKIPSLIFACSILLPGCTEKGVVTTEVPDASQDKGTNDLPSPSIERLIDELCEIDSVAPGLHPTAITGGFIGEDSIPTMDTGIIGSERPITSSAMKELVRQGVKALPVLIAHLKDKRPTRLSVKPLDPIIGGFYFSNEYDPKSSSDWPKGTQEKSIEKDAYTVRIGDVCYALIGQIVNRRFYAIRYQPTAITIINSPLEFPELAEKAKRDWLGLTPSAHEEELIKNARSENPWVVEDAFRRIRFYYPAAYTRLKTTNLKNSISSFEERENFRLEKLRKAQESRQKK